MKPLAPNTLLQNRYLVVHLIGKGGMGEVYLAVDQRLGSAVALKRTFFSDDVALGTAFEREARTLARLRHPALPKVSDHFIENENQYLVMDHIAGEDLSKRLEATQKPFPLSWVLFWADQLLDALAYLHAHEPPIIHRDIKPQNLKLTDDNNIILLDFGLSKNSLGETRISSAGSVGYTPHYASMEQIRGTGTSPRSDIYSLSATLYQLLTNKVPPDALSRADALLNGKPDPIEPVEQLNKEVTKVVSDVILKGMAVSQEQRFAIARDMQRELRDAYAQMQKAMAAQTVAFNAQGNQIVPEEVSPQGLTEPMIAAPTENQTPVQPEPPAREIARSFDDELSKGETLPYNLKQRAESEEQDFDKTIAYDSPPADTAAIQPDANTEAFANDFVSGSEAEPEEKPETNESIAAEATMPLISYDEAANESKPAEIETVLKTPQTEAESESVAPVSVEDFSNSQQQYSQKQQYAQPPPAQAIAAPPVKKKGKALAIAGVLAVLLFLALGGAAAGWYFYNNKSFSINPATPTPTPESTIEPSPSPSPSQEILVETNTNTNTNSETGDLGNTNTQNTNQQEITQTEIPGVTPRPSPSAVRPTPKKTEISTAGTPRQTPKPTPKKGGRTDILQ